LPKPRSKRSPFLDELEKNECKVEVLYFLNPKGRCPVEDEFLNTKKVPKNKKAQLAALIRRYAKEGKIENEELCHRLKGKVKDFWVFKRKAHRLYFFKENEFCIVLTHGFVKKKDELESEQETRMLSIRYAYNNLTLYK
jgi:hypothetical protein